MNCNENHPSCFVAARDPNSGFCNSVTQVLGFECVFIMVTYSNDLHEAVARSKKLLRGPL